MLSIRSLARAAPRAVTRLTTSSLRTSAKPSLVKAAFTTLRTQAAAPFSTSTIQRAKAGEVDDELVTKLDSELAMEQDMKENSEVPISVKEYLENGPFEIKDTPGEEEVVLTRKFGDET
jgi:complement component 1 Q subcomponent-binding protein